MPDLLYEEVIEVEERVVLHQESCQLQLPVPLVHGNTGEKVHMEFMDLTRSNFQIKIPWL